MNGKIRTLFRECVQTINFANNIIVIKTLRGNGSTAGVFVDSLQFKEIIGSIAGDDTLLIVVDTNENTARIADKLREYII